MNNLSTILILEIKNPIRLKSKEKKEFNKIQENRFKILTKNEIKQN